LPHAERLIMSTLTTIHLCAISFWFGVIGAEFVIERSRAESKPHGFAVARNHYWIDLLLEIPAAIIVLISGALMLSSVALTPLLVVKVLAGSIAVGVNLICIVPVARRKAAADAQQLAEVVRHSRRIDQITVIGLPAGLVALLIGLCGT
jgi:hypothetical protein